MSSGTSNYPEKYIRGISLKEAIDESGLVTYSVFDFSINAECDREESSVNWFDDKNALNEIISRKHDKKPEKLQFEFGVAIFPTAELDKIKKRPLGIQCQLDYERHPSNGNEFHGNLFIRKGLPKPLKTMIKSLLADSFECVIPSTKD